ncbi:MULTISPECIES: PAS domain-containing protein [unclassified Sphingobium]|uniref:PAS domain-containing protein n=1 Tax=unclassified Sphingobium TaxID=2611147 RepID=UPI0022257E67|nr:MULTISPECIES: PAS domain-containing protein [unclassified Sphingobium]MCW2351519.1 PAS domain S-box-containing protein [Sphingobium sp. B12D2B]MCW2380674.1 PAS domain S-box-containing protein [Sphingobium sp. B2D3B]MCW2399218.1 PAS domain S-box-containing protein [Sphingobium sp. B2D3C]
MAIESGDHNDFAAENGDTAASDDNQGTEAAEGRVTVRGKDHWRERTITAPGLSERGNVFFAAIEMTRMPMILTDPNLPDNPIVFANKAFLDLTLYEESEIIGRNCRFLQGAETDRERIAELRDAVARHESIALEILNYRRDGTPFWNAVFIGPVYDVSGKLLYFFASQLDVTKRRETEQVLRQAQKMEAIGQLTAGLAHDFNNLLQVIGGSLELASNRIEDERAGRHIENAQHAAARGAKLTGQLLAFARKTRLTPRSVDVSDCVQSFVHVLESALGSDIELHLSLRRGLPRIHVDPDQFEMAVLNIVMNAKDAMRGAGGLVTITTGKLHLNGDAAARQLPPGDYISLEVTDEGEGMPAHVAQRATEPFFTTKPTGQGTGLGLAMASGFLQQSRGRLEIESEQGVGSTIRLLFPVSVQNDEDDRAGNPAPITAAAPADGSSGKAHILVVEDSPEVMALSREILESAGYRVSTAISGDEGLKALQKLMEADPVDLLFTDLVMPGSLNGILLAEEAVKLVPGIAILMTTGYNEQLVSDGPQTISQDVIGKPYRPAELLNRVEQALKNRATAGDARRHRSDYGHAEA